MGCNMSSAAGAHTAAVAQFDRPVFEVIGPGSAAACAAGRGAVGVIATLGTVNSGAYGRALCACGATAVYQQPCPKFVPLVEAGITDGPEAEAAVAEYLAPLRDAGIDTLVFGCTHYPFLRAPIARFLGPDVILIDPADAVADQVAAQFGTGLAHADPSRHRFFCSGDPAQFRKNGEFFLGLPLHSVAQVNVPTE
jgi:glutamate racemase